MRSMPKINASLNKHKEEHQSSMIEIEGTISQTLVNILIDTRSSLSYISPMIAEKCKLVKEKYK